MNLGDILIVWGTAASPVVELRGAIPLALYTFHFPWYWALAISLGGNLLPVPFLLLLLERLFPILGKIRPLQPVLSWLFQRTRRRGGLIERYGALGLMLFVAVPLPLTGAWTGSLAAVLFGLRFSRALMAIALGVAIAGIVVTSLSLLGWWGAVVAGLGVAALTSLRLLGVKTPFGSTGKG